MIAPVTIRSELSRAIVHARSNGEETGVDFRSRATRKLNPVSSLACEDPTHETPVAHVADRRFAVVRHARRRPGRTSHTRSARDAAVRSGDRRDADETVAVRLADVAADAGRLG